MRPPLCHKLNKLTKRLCKILDALTMTMKSMAMDRNLDDCDKMSIIQTRRGWFQECMGCEAKSEFKYYNR